MRKQDLGAQVSQLLSDFAAHNHDGSNSRQLPNIVSNSIQAKAAVIGGYRLFEAVVGPSQADFTSVAAALQAGKTRIFVRNGTYTGESRWLIQTANTVIIGESESGVNITFAADAVNAQNIRVSTPYFICDNMTLTAYETTTHSLFFFTSTGLYPVCTRLSLRNERGPCFEGDVPGGLHVKVFGIFRDIYINQQVALDVSISAGFLHIDDSVADNIYFDQTGSGTAANILCSACSNLIFTNCRQRATAAANLPSVLNSGPSQFVNCTFYCTGMICEAQFSACYFENNAIDPNGNTVSGYFIDMDLIETSIIGCRFKLDKTYQFLKITSSDVIFSNNYIDGGKKILLTAGTVFYGVVITNNIWRTQYTVAAVDLNIGANSSYANVLGNILHGKTNTPTITDGGTASNVVSNQLFVS